MKIWIKGVIVFLTLVSSLGIAGETTLTPVEILRKSDEARGNLSGVTWTVNIEAIEGGSSSDRRIAVKARGFDVYAFTEAPPRHKGDTLIMIDGNMWFFQPDLSKPVPISRRQKLMGKAANGDIAATNYADDYRVISFSEDNYKGEDCYLFNLDAKNTVSTYSRIKYWVAKDRMVGIKAEYYTTNGEKLIKSAFMTFDNRIKVPGGDRPFISSMLITDQLTSRDKTTLFFSDPHFTAIPDETFNLNLLKR